MEKIVKAMEEIETSNGEIKYIKKECEDLRRDAIEKLRKQLQNSDFEALEKQLWKTK